MIERKASYLLGLTNDEREALHRYAENQGTTAADVLRQWIREATRMNKDQYRAA